MDLYSFSWSKSGTVYDKNAKTLILEPGEEKSCLRDAHLILLCIALKGNLAVSHPGIHVPEF